MEKMIDSTELLVNTKNQKVNYDKILRQMIQTWQAGGVRPKLIIHSCCVPCSTYTLEFLSTYADVTIYFANSNIHPEAEYRRRALIQKAFVHDFNQRPIKTSLSSKKITDQMILSKWSWRENYKMNLKKA